MFKGMQWLIDIIKSMVSEVPAGTIILWPGLKADIPTGYVACDGENGTPDLRGLFVKCAGLDNPPLGTGGALTHQHPFTTSGHQHPFTTNGHAHGMASGNDLGGAGEVANLTTTVQDYGMTNSVGDSGTTSDTNHLPPFMNLWFIMKT